MIACKLFEREAEITINFFSCSTIDKIVVWKQTTNHSDEFATSAIGTLRPNPQEYKPRIKHLFMLKICPYPTTDKQV